MTPGYNTEGDRGAELRTRAAAGYWAVVQSTVDIGAADIWQRLAPCMETKTR